jgi:hypothetical protein
MLNSSTLRFGAAVVVVALVVVAQIAQAAAAALVYRRLFKFTAQVNLHLPCP